MGLRHFFFPQNIQFPDSRFNKNISVYLYQNSAMLSADGLVESGDIMTRVWKKGITSLLPKRFFPKTVLLLGLAGGSNARLINRLFPQAQITAVEIDPFMIKLGQKYFNLKKIKNMKIVIDDAKSFVEHLKQSDHFDLVLIDCFIGKKIPTKLESADYLKKIKKHSRFVLVNRLWWKNEKILSQKFFSSISPHLFFIKAHTRSNVVISLV